MLIDDKDKKILNSIQHDGKISFQRLQEEVEMAASSIHNRVKKLEKKGIIKKYQAIIDPEKVGYKSIAWIGLSVDPLKLDFIAEKLASYSEVQIVASSSGDHDLIIQLIAKNTKELWRFINGRIKTIDGVNSNMDVSNFIDVYKMAHEIELK